jgi:hypothetical protein
LANETLRELAPLLAEEGIDVDNIDVPDLDTLQQAMNRAVERHNLMRFTPVGVARDDALDVLREVTDAWATEDSDYAGELLDSVPPAAPDGDGATVAGCIGVALGLLDDWLSARATAAPSGLGRQVALPAGHWTGERAATDILALARKGRAGGSIDSLHCSARRETRPLRRRACRRRRHPGLVRHHRHTHPAAGRHPHPLTAATILSTSQVRGSVATTTRIRPVTVGPNELDVAILRVHQ